MTPSYTMTWMTIQSDDDDDGGSECVPLGCIVCVRPIMWLMDNVAFGWGCYPTASPTKIPVC